MAYLQAKVNNSSTWSKQDCRRELTGMQLLQYPQNQLGRREKERGGGGKAARLRVELSPSHCRNGARNWASQGRS